MCRQRVLQKFKCNSTSKIIENSKYITFIFGLSKAYLLSVLIQVISRYRK